VHSLRSMCRASMREPLRYPQPVDKTLCMFPADEPRHSRLRHPTTPHRNRTSGRPARGMTSTLPTGTEPARPGPVGLLARKTAAHPARSRAMLTQRPADAGQLKPARKSRPRQTCAPACTQTAPSSPTFQFGQKNPVREASANRRIRQRNLTRK